MPDEKQEPKATPAEPGSSPADAQPPVTPSTREAGQAAAEPSGPTAELGAADEVLAREQRRLSGLQRAKDRQISEAQRQAEEAQKRAEALEAQVTELRMQGMTQEERATFLKEQRELEFEKRDRELAERQAELEQREYLGYWYSVYLSRGVPAEMLNECRNFAEMEQAQWDWMQERGEKPPAASPAAGQPPPVTSADQVQAGGIGAPPSREIDKLTAEGHGPGTAEFREYLRKQRRSGRGELL